MAYPEKKERNDELCRLYLAGLTRDEVATKLGMTRSCVNRILHQRGVKLPKEEFVARVSRARVQSFQRSGSSPRRSAPRSWPECPEALREDYKTLCAYMPAAEARATLEGQRQ